MLKKLTDQSLHEETLKLKELKYSESSAYRRIQSMRLLKDIPQVEEKIESGEVNLSNLAKTQSFIKQIEKSEDRKITHQEKQNLVQQIESKTQKEVESLFAQIKPELATPQKDKVISPSRVLLSFSISCESRSKLQKLEELSGKPHDLEELCAVIQTKFLRRAAPLRC